MWAVKVTACRGFTGFLPWNRITQSLPKTYSTLNFLTTQHSARNGATQTFNLFNRPSRFHQSCRKVITIPAKAMLSPTKIVGGWLLVCSGMVYGAILIGGYTRLTESGLSMVTWKFTYEKMPTTEDEWVEEFKKYQEFPEFKQLKKNLTVEEFKKIFLNEYAHRNWGRMTGIIYLAPATIFWLKGFFTPKMRKRVLAFGLMIAAQGLLGWYMVKSGLEDRFHNESDVPRVSQYRLAAHLGLALTLYASLFWNALDLLLPAIPFSVPFSARKLKMLAHSCKGLVFLTALSGAFVAGLDAGLIYNSFPKMGDSWIPDDILGLSPKIKNFTENPTTVQFDHRILGITTISVITSLWFLCRKYNLPTRTKLVVSTLQIVACAQAAMGISTLIHYVPTAEAVSHQAGAVILLTLATWMSHELKHLKYLPK